MTLNKSSSLPAILALGTTAPKLAGGWCDGTHGVQIVKNLGSIARAFLW